MKRSVNAPGGVAVQVNVNTAANEAGSRVLERLDAMLARQPALPPPSEQPMQIELLPEKDIVNA
jgi:hypothetical protein